jgi:hypothetical protein
MLLVEGDKKPVGSMKAFNNPGSLVAPAHLASGGPGCDTASSAYPAWSLAGEGVWVRASPSLVEGRGSLAVGASENRREAGRRISDA